MKLMELNHVNFRYQLEKEKLLTDIHFSIERGEFIGVIGRNGVGKTTLCNIMRGIIPAFVPGEFNGEVRFEGKLLNEYSAGELAKKIGFVFQNPFIQISGIKETVFEEIAFGLENLGVERLEIIEKVERIMDRLSISDLKDKKPTELSGGQSQRVALASVLVMEPELLIVDEPTSQLDPQSTEEVFDILAFLKENRQTVVLVEHKIDLLSEYADRMLVLHDGQIAMDGKTKDVLTDQKIEEFGVSLPKVTKLSYQLMAAGKVTLPRVPTTLAEAEALYREVTRNDEQSRIS